MQVNYILYVNVGDSCEFGNSDIKILRAGQDYADEMAKKVEDSMQTNSAVVGISIVGHQETYLCSIDSDLMSRVALGTGSDNINISNNAIQY